MRLRRIHPLPLVKSLQLLKQQFTNNSTKLDSTITASPCALLEQFGRSHRRRTEIVDSRGREDLGERGRHQSGGMSRQGAHESAEKGQTHTHTQFESGMHKNSSVGKLRTFLRSQLSACCTTACEFRRLCVRAWTEVLLLCELWTDVGTDDFLVKASG